MPRTGSEPVAAAVLAKVPIAGFAKTRLATVIGSERAAVLQQALTEHAVATAVAAETGPVTLWGAPDEFHPSFQALAAQFGVALARQPDGDLGARMLAAFASASGPALVIGTDCPVLAPAHLREAAGILRNGLDAVAIPVEDGGYALIGARKPWPELFAGIVWSTETVMAETRRRLQRLGLSWREPATLWDLDRPADLTRLRASGLGHLIPARS